MLNFLVLGTLTGAVLLSFVVQMLIVTTVVRAAMAGQQWIYWRSCRVRADLVVLAHVIALFLFAAMTDFVDAGAPSLGFPAAMFHSAAILWPLQIPLLIADLAIRAGLSRRKTAE